MPFHSNHNRGPRPDRESKSDKRQQDRIRQREANKRQENRKKKEKTLFGFKIGPPPKSDVQKKIDSGQATVIATKSSGKIVTTPTMDNKSLIMSKATQQKTKTDYLSSAKNLAKAKPAIGKAINPPPKKFEKASENFADFPVDSKPASPIFNKASYMVKGGKQEYKGAPQLLEADKKLLSKNTKAGKGITTPTPPPKDSYTGPIFNKASYMVKGGKQEYKGQPTLLRGGDKGTKSGGTFASKEARQLLANAVREGKGQYQGVLPTATTNFMGQKRRVAKVGSNFFRIKSNRRLAKDPMSGIQLKYFKNQLAKGTNELKWSLVK